MSRRPQAIYIDCTATFYTGLQTGIQRVVRNVVARAGDLATETGVPIIPVAYSLGRFWRISPSRLQQQVVGGDVAVSFLRRVLNKAIRAGTEVKRHLEKSRWAYLVARAVWRPAAVALRAAMMGLSTRGLKRVKLQDGDVLLYADAWWMLDVLERVEEWSARCSVIAVLYDLIPVTHPELVQEVHRQGYWKAFERLVNCCDGFIAISRSVSDEAREQLESSRKRVPILDYFYLGADLEGEASGKRRRPSARHWPAELWGSEPVYLMVGTIEPRKGHQYVLDVFERLWSQGFGGKLLIVGRVGWMCEDIVSRLENSPYRGKNLFVIVDANDGDLAYCYRMATAIVFASATEGFGLPLVEAMEYGKPALVSDIPVFREVGQDYPVYFSLKSPDSLVTAIYQLQDKLKSGAVVAPRRWLTWDDSARMLVNKVFAVYERRGGVS